MLGRSEVGSLLTSQLCALHLKIHFFAPPILPLFLLPLLFPSKFPTAPMKSFDVSNIPDLPGKVTFVTGGPAEFFHSRQWLTRLWAKAPLRTCQNTTRPTSSFPAATPMLLPASLKRSKEVPRMLSSLSSLVTWPPSPPLIKLPNSSPPNLSDSTYSSATLALWPYRRIYQGRL